MEPQAVDRIDQTKKETLCERAGPTTLKRICWTRRREIERVILRGGLRVRKKAKYEIVIYRLFTLGGTPRVLVLNFFLGLKTKLGLASRRSRLPRVINQSQCHVSSGSCGSSTRFRPSRPLLLKVLTLLRELDELRLQLLEDPPRGGLSRECV